MIKEQLSFLVTSLFQGSVPALANFLIDSNNLSLKDIRTIKQFIEKKEQEIGDRIDRDN